MVKNDWDLGYNQGYAVGFEAGYEKGYAQGSSLGFNNGLAAGLKDSFESSEPLGPLSKFVKMLRGGLIRLVISGPATQDALDLLKDMEINAEPLDFD